MASVFKAASFTATLSQDKHIQAFSPTSICVDSRFQAQVSVDHSAWRKPMTNLQSQHRKILKPRLDLNTRLTVRKLTITPSCGRRRPINIIWLCEIVGFFSVKALSQFYFHSTQNNALILYRKRCRPVFWFVVFAIK